MTQLRTFCRIFALSAFAFLFVSVAAAFAATGKTTTFSGTGPNAQIPTFSCAVNTVVTPTLRPEGFTELVGDINLNCTGGTLQGPNNVIPQANITFSLNNPSQTPGAQLLIVDAGLIKASDGSQTAGVINGNSITYTVPFPDTLTIGSIKLEAPQASQGGPFSIKIDVSGSVLGSPIQFNPSTLLLSASSTLGQGGQTTTITITDPSATLQLFLGKKDAKGRDLPPVDVPHAPDGTFKIDPSFYGTGPVPDSLIPYYCEPDGPTILAVPGLSLDQIPCPKGKKPMAIVILGGGPGIPVGGSATISRAPDGSLAVTITSGVAAAKPAPAATAPAPAPAAAAARESQPFGLGYEFGAMIGANVYSSVNSCPPLLAVGAASCHAGDTSPLVGAYGGVTFGNYLGVFGGYDRAFDINRNATLSGATEHSSAQTQSETITGRLSLPVARILPFAEGGVAFTQTHLGETESVGSGPLHTSFNINTTTYVVGGGFMVSLFSHLQVGAFVHYTPVQKGALLNDHNIATGFIFSVSSGTLSGWKSHNK